MNAYRPPNREFSTKNWTLLGLLFLISSLAVEDAHSADLYRKTVEVYNTGGIGLRAWTGVCSGTYINKPDGARGIVETLVPEACSGYNRWKVRWDGDSIDRWSAEDWLRVIPPDLTISGEIEISPLTPTVGGEIVVSCIIANIADGNARPSGTTIRLLKSDTLENVAQVNDIETFEVPPHETIAFSYSLPIPMSIDVGRYLVQVEVDSLYSIGQRVVINDSRESTPFSVSKEIVVTSTTETAGGRISPSGDRSVKLGESLSFTATPNFGFGISEWKVNGVLAQNGGSLFTLKDIRAETAVTVSFVRLYRLVFVIDGGGSYTLEPPGQEYPAGTRVVITPVPDSNRAFLGWNQDASGSGQPLVITVNRNMTIGASFIPIPTPVPIGLSIGGPTPDSRSVLLGIPALNAAYLLLIKITNDGINWFNYDAILGDGNPITPVLPTFPPGQPAICKLEIAIPQSEPGFLDFPIRGFDNPYSVPISAIFDHDETENRVIRTYRNELTGKFPVVSDQSPSLIGYKKDESGTLFDLRFAYSDKSVLMYDGHTGYDFPATKSTEIIAADDGSIDWPLTVSQSQWNGICIRHDNGYCSFYLHLSRWDDTIREALPTRAIVRVFKGNTIGWAGNIGVPGATGDKFVHLHFGIHDPQGKRTDPYGEFSVTGKPIRPVLWKYPPPN